MRTQAAEEVLVVIHGGGHDFPPIGFTIITRSFAGDALGSRCTETTQDFFDDESTNVH